MMDWFSRRRAIWTTASLLFSIVVFPGCGGPVASAQSESASSVDPLDSPLGQPVPVSAVTLDESPRPWVDSTGKYSTVATLIGLDGEAAVLRSPNGVAKPVPFERLSEGDAAYARTRAAPRVDPKSDVMIGSVVGITDGDTIKVRTIDGHTRTIRLDGIDAPESEQPFGTRAKQQLGDWVFQEEIRAEVSELDRYGRYVAQIYVDGQWVNRGLIRSGLAWHYVQYSSDKELAAAERAAREAALGIWSTRNHVAPWDWRRGDRGSPEVAAGPSTTTPSRQTSGMGRSVVPFSPPVVDEDSTPSAVPAGAGTVYITKTGSKYHRAGCQHLSKSMIPISRVKAEARYSPCSRCDP